MGNPVFLNFINTNSNRYSNISSNNHFGFPITNTKEYNPYYFGTICKPGIKKFYTTVNQNIILMDLYNKNKNKYYPNIPHPEVEVIFERKKGKIRIKVSKNETLIKERKTKINETNINEYALEYLKSFWKAYINQNKMFLYQSLDGHEPSGQAIGHLDKIFYKFLTKFYQRGYLNKTAIFIFSDHGQHLNGPLYLFNSQDFYYERTLPGLFLILPNDEKLYKNNLYENIKLNQQTFITGFDIYNTLVHLAFGNNKKKFDKYKVKNGETLFKKINYKNRYCESKILNLHLSHRICNCRKN